GRVVALIALPAAGAGQRLVHVLDGQDPEGAGHAGIELGSLDPVRSSLADVVVVVGLAPDHGSQAYDAQVASGPGTGLGRERQLEGARNVMDVQTFLAHAFLCEAAYRAGGQALREVVVEGGANDREALFTHAGLGRRRGPTARRAQPQGATPPPCVCGPCAAPRGTCPRPSA